MPAANSKLKHGQPPKQGPKKRIRDKPLMVYVTAEEIEHFRAAADADQRSLSDWIRVNLRKITRFSEPKKS